MAQPNGREDLALARRAGHVLVLSWGRERVIAGEAARLSEFFTGEKIRSGRKGSSVRFAGDLQGICRGFAGICREFFKKNLATLRYINGLGQE
jgi:hypothetical protein